MSINRRDALKSLGAMAASAAVTRLEAQMPDLAPSIPAAEFPRKSDFDIADGYTYISGAFTHPMPRVAADAYRAALDRRWSLGRQAPPPPPTVPRANAKEAFAALINARPAEISYIANTSTGENLVVESLGIGKTDGNVVTDGLHFEGALVHLLELKKQGLDLRMVMPREGRIDLKDMERVIDRKTRLVEVSFVSMYNGFQHDLKAVCDLAHAYGAYVYADIIQGVGAVPLDVRATGLDFAACATYKWLMGDFGLGFLFVREELLGKVIQRPHWGWTSAADTDFHWSPFDPKAPLPVSYTPGTDATRYFELGTMATAIAAVLGVSIPYIQGLGVENIQAHRQPLLQKLQAELPRLGFRPQTPPDSTSPIVTFAHRDADTINRKLQAARVNVRVAPFWMRIAPSVYNDMADVDRLLEALS